MRLSEEKYIFPFVTSVSAIMVLTSRVFTREDMSRVKHSFGDGPSVLSSDLPGIVKLEWFFIIYGGAV